MGAVGQVEGSGIDHQAHPFFDRKDAGERGAVIQITGAEDGIAAYIAERMGRGFGENAGIEPCEACRRP